MSSPSPSETATLFHGPEAHERALASAIGVRLVGDFGPEEDERGIRISVFREIVPILGSVVVGDLRGAAVIGPVDVASQPGSEDVLLKALEEIHPATVLPILWARDLGSVRGTIRSRCFSVWCPGRWTLDPEAVDVAGEAVAASLSGDVVGVLEVMGRARARWADHGEDVVRAVVDVLARMRGSEQLGLWMRVRGSVTHRGVPSHTDLLSAMLP